MKSLFPLFIVGSPRSETTFLCSVLNLPLHPLIQLTNESAGLLLKDMLDVGSNRPDLLSTACRDRFSTGWRTLARVERLYREELQSDSAHLGRQASVYADLTQNNRPHSLVDACRVQELAWVDTPSCLRKRALHSHPSRSPPRCQSDAGAKHWIGSISDGMAGLGTIRGRDHRAFLTRSRRSWR